MFIPNSIICYNKNRVDHILKLYDLENIYSYVYLTNSSARFPYHNQVHTDFMIEDCFTIASVEDTLNIEHLLIAAIFHDYRHTGTSDEEENIKRAIDGLKNCEFLTKYTNQDMEIITDIIECTAYNSKDKCFYKEPKTAAQRFIRDADLCTIFHIFETKGVNQIFGLREELQKSRNFDYNLELFYNDMNNFLNNATFYSYVGGYLKEYHLNECLKELKQLCHV